MLIVGGGPVGVEVAAEILHRFPAKKVRGCCHLSYCCLAVQLVQLHRQSSWSRGTGRAPRWALHGRVDPHGFTACLFYLQVRLVCAHSTLLDRMDPQAKEFAAKWLHQNGVEVVTGMRIRWVKMEGGNKIARAEGSCSSSNATGRQPGQSAAVGACR